MSEAQPVQWKLLSVEAIFERMAKHGVYSAFRNETGDPEIADAAWPA